MGPSDEHLFIDPDAEQASPDAGGPRLGRLRPRSHEVTITIVLVGVVVSLIVVGLLRRDPVASAPRVAVVGDSLTMQASWAIDDRLGGDGWLVAVSGRNGATIGDQYDQLISYTGFDGADVLVAALGTNNAYYVTVDDDRRLSRAATIDELDRAVHDILQGPPQRTWEVSVRCLVWVNVRDDTSGLQLDAQAPALNAEIAARAAAEREAGRQMLVADWAARSRDHDEWFVADGVHLTPEGQRAYAELIGETVAACER